MATQKFNIPISQEGETGPVRGKIPTSMVNAMGAQDGDVLVIETNRRTIVGGHIATGKEAARYRADITPRGRNGSNGSAGKSSGRVKAKSQKVVKKTKQQASSSRVKPKVKNKVKSNKRRTSVQYDTAPPTRKKVKIKLGKKGRK